MIVSSWRSLVRVTGIILAEFHIFYLFWFIMCALYCYPYWFSNYLLLSYKMINEAYIQIIYLFYIVRTLDRSHIDAFLWAFYKQECSIFNILFKNNLYSIKMILTISYLICFSNKYWVLIMKLLFLY